MVISIEPEFVWRQREKPLVSYTIWHVPDDEFDKLTNEQRQVTGHPVMWRWRTDGSIEVWPEPTDDIEIVDLRCGNVVVKLR